MQQEREATYSPVSSPVGKDECSYSTSVHSSRRLKDTVLINKACLFMVRILLNKGQNICLCKSVVCIGDFVNSGDYVSMILFIWFIAAVNPFNAQG
jgi:hypothetical protein